MLRRTPLLLAAALTLAACDSATAPRLDPAASRSVTVSFGVVRPTSTSLSRAPGIAFAAAPAADSLVLTGSNGTLTVSDIRVIVAKLQLQTRDSISDREDEHCEESPDCEGFRAPPSLVRVSLGGNATPVTTSTIPAGTYRALKFMVRSVHLDEDDSAEEGQPLRNLWEQIRADVPDWPERGSMLVSGTFQPKGDSAAMPFRIFIDAKIRIRTELNPPLVVGDSASGADVAVSLDPAAWFGRADGTVVDLSQLDYGRTDKLVKFDLRKGFRAKHQDHGRGRKHD